jgi:hypothetical protein
MAIAMNTATIRGSNGHKSEEDEEETEEKGIADD